ncbi:MAG: DegQ family serine endoprotease [Gammaproteobacteria bacterium]|nr:DegQ family serine endoprotease [Gammaproteobacteria bacterium]
MTKRCLILAALIILFNTAVGAAVPVQALAAASGQEMPSLAPMLDRVTPAVVNISTRSKVLVKDNPLLNDPFFGRFFNTPERYREKESQSLGSGVVVDAKKGYILTNNHVIDKADEITVTLRDNRKFTAKLLGTDPDTDIAVIQVNAKNLTDVGFSDSDVLRVGDFVVAIGNPFGLGQTVTSGIVSALGRSGLGIEGFEDFIQTDASINPGNSGGALVNLRGELVGINTAILSKSGGNVGIGFAIPTNMVKDIMNQLVTTGEVKRGRLGVYVQDLTPELARAFGMTQLDGAIISQVHPASPAEKAGLKAGDVIVSVSSRRVNNSADLRNVVGLLRVGREVALEIVRNGKKQKVSAIITAQEQQRIDGKMLSNIFSGAVLGIVRQDGINSAQNSGIQVVKLAKNTPAWNTGLRKDDVIIAVNRALVSDFEELKKALRRSQRGILLNVRRGDTGLYLLVQ